jgi:hypothetical protein
LRDLLGDSLGQLGELDAHGRAARRHRRLRHLPRPPRLNNLRGPLRFLAPGGNPDGP